LFTHLSKQGAYLPSFFSMIDLYSGFPTSNFFLGSWENFDVQLPQQDPPGMATWWEDVASKVPKQEHRTFNGVLIYVVWNLWKERNRRIFENEHKTSEQVAYLAKEDIVQRRRAMCSAG
jgi:hypothetical protein